MEANEDGTHGPQHITDEGRELRPDDLTHYMQKCSELAQQLEQARKSVVRFEAEVVPEYVAQLEALDKERYEAQQQLEQAEQRIAVKEAGWHDQRGMAERYREALEPFADDYSWHHNYDGSGVIFQPPGAYYEKDVQAYLDKAKAALTPDESDEEV